MTRSSRTVTAPSPPIGSSEPDPRREFAVRVVRQLVEAGFIALWAGGCVRDLLMGRHPDDYDVATTATPDQVRDLFGRRRTLAVGESFGVVIVLGPQPAGQVEVATFRTEGPYADGRRPDHVAFATPEEDACRRDFTINGMFYDPLSERVLDYVHGEHDLRAGILRAIGDPHARMTEDKLRLLRAVRFAATLDFELDPHTAEAIQAMAAQILVVSWERIAAELQKMLRHAHRRRAMRLAQQLGLLVHILPELAAELTADDGREWTHTLNILDRLATARFEPAAAVLLRAVPLAIHRRREVVETGTVGAACRRLRLSNQQQEEIAWLVEHRAALRGATAFRPARLKRLLAHSLASELIAIAKATAAAENASSTDVDFADNYLRTTPREVLDPPPLITGADLLQCGFRPGPDFKLWLDGIREAQLNGEVADRAGALALVRELADRPSTG